MELFIATLLFAAGLALIIKGGDYFVDASSWLAEITGIPKFVIGATIVSIATTLPEQIVSIIAVMQEKNDIAIGNAVGSVIANIGLILAISCIVMPLVIERKAFAGKALLLLASVCILFIFILDGNLNIYESIIMLCILAVYFYMNLKYVPRSNKSSKSGSNDNNTDTDRIKPNKKTVIINIIKFVLGAAGIVVGARLMVDNATTIALAVGVSEKFIGLTIVAVGTSLPELITTITALRKKEAAMSVGNIIGANIINLTMILPVCSLISSGGLVINDQTIKTDMPVAILFTAVTVLIPLALKKFVRWQGIALISMYIGYVIYIANI